MCVSASHGECACVCVRLCAHACECVRVCVRAHVRVCPCVCVRVCVHVRVWECVCVPVCGDGVCVSFAMLHTWRVLIHNRAPYDNTVCDRGVVVCVRVGDNVRDACVRVCVMMCVVCVCVGG